MASETEQAAKDAAAEGYDKQAFLSGDMGVFVRSPNKAIFVAPIFETRQGGVRVKVGERLTERLPVHGNERIYYGRKGLRLASREDIIRISGQNKEKVDGATSVVRCPTCQKDQVLLQADCEEFVQKRMLVRLACGDSNTLNRRDVVVELVEEKPAAQKPPPYVKEPVAAGKGKA